MRGLIAASFVAAAAADKCSSFKGSCGGCLDTKIMGIPCAWCVKSQSCKSMSIDYGLCAANCIGSKMHYPFCKQAKCPAPGPTPPTPPAPAPPTPPTPPAPVQQYACVGGQCVVATAGGIDKQSCIAQCGGTPPAPTPPTPPAPTPPTPPAPTPPAPTPPAPATGGPKAGQLYCGSVGGGIILVTNLTIGADGASMEYNNHIVIASTIVHCPGEPYVFQPGVGCDPTVKGKAGCGTMDITKATSDPNDCLAKAGADEGGATHTFIYDGPEAGTISSKDTKYGTVEMKLTTGGKC